MKKSFTTKKTTQAQLHAIDVIEDRALTILGCKNGSISYERLIFNSFDVIHQLNLFISETTEAPRIEKPKVKMVLVNKERVITQPTKIAHGITCYTTLNRLEVTHKLYSKCKIDEEKH